MGYYSFTHIFSNYCTIRFFSRKSLLFQIVLTTLLFCFIVVVPVQANESQIKIVDVWVEDGFLFHVVFETHPNNSSCVLNGEGLIEFEVVYTAQTSSGLHSAYSVAIWYPGSNPDDWIRTHGEALGPQAFCSASSPCPVHAVNIINTWCPDIEGPFFQQ